MVESHWYDCVVIGMRGSDWCGRVVTGMTGGVTGMTGESLV